MANTKISALTEKSSSFTGDEEFVINDAGTSKKVKYSNLYTVTDTTPGSAAYEYVTGSDINWNPAGGSTTLAVASQNRMTFTGGGDVTGAGHAIGVHGQAVMNTPHTAILMIGTEGSVDNQNGTITDAIGVVGTIIDNAVGKTITKFVSVKANVNANHGTITTMVGHEVGCTSNAGTITNYVGFNCLDMGGISGITRKKAFYNDNTDAPVVSRSAVCDASLATSVPTSGGTTAIPRDTSTYLLLPAGTLASHTLTWPTTCENGQTIFVYSTQTITTLNYTAGPTMYGIPATLAANTGFTMRYFSGIGGWVRIT